MTNILIVRPQGSATDRLMVTLFLAILVHALVILGVQFDIERPSHIEKSLEIALVDHPTQAAPDEADFLAQANQIGSGTEKTASIPQQPSIPAAGVAEPKPTTASVSKKAAPKVVTRKVAQAQIRSKEEDSDDPKVEATPLTAAGIYEQIQALSSEISAAQERYAKRPRIKFINSVNAHRYKAAAYEKAWQNKVERIGNLNYPDQARREHLSGSLLLAVGIRKDGTIYRIEVRRSSGHQALDDGAIRIVRLSAPFAPFPEDLTKEADVLVITRTWKFSDDSQLTTSP